jgi:hypothetical protein
MMIATMTWLIASTTLVSALASLVMGGAKDAGPGADSHP